MPHTPRSTVAATVGEWRRVLEGLPDDMPIRIVTDDDTLSTTVDVEFDSLALYADGDGLILNVTAIDPDEFHPHDDDEDDDDLEEDGGDLHG